MDVIRIRNAPRVARALMERPYWRTRAAMQRLRSECLPELRVRADRWLSGLRAAPRRLRRAYHNSDFYLSRHAPPIAVNGAGSATAVDEYWGEWTINSTPFETARDSRDYLEWRFEEYPLFREFAGLWGDRADEVILDYGCGPGNDVVGLLLNTRARKVIGMDISRKSLELARRRVALHKIDTDRVELIKIADAEPEVPLRDDSIDYFQSFGVLHMTTDPAAILRELHRVLKPGRLSRVMVYNHHSVWLHLYTAYVKQILEGRWPELRVEEAFSKTTDGEDCPISRSYTPEQFGELCAAAGFEVDFVGGHLSRQELEVHQEHAERALADDRLDERHQRFLRELEFDDDGYPMWRGKHAGVGAVYELRS